jgi:hypothetical protein
VQRKVPEHNVGAFPVGPVMLRKEPWMCLHVVVQKKQNVSARRSRPPVSSGGRASVQLFKNGEGKWNIHFSERFRHSVL